jgi:type I restriction enzyme S subunit
MVLRADTTKLLPMYLYFYLKSEPVIEELQMLAETRSGTFPQITFKELSNLTIPVPSIEEQEAIVAIIKCLEDKIDCNASINDNLQQQALAIFQQELLQEGELPEGWTNGNLLDIANYLNGLAMQKFRPAEGETGLPVLKIKELRQGSCDASSELCSPSIKSEYIIHDGDVIFSWSGSLLVDLWCGGTCGLNQHLFKVTSEKYPKWFYYAWTAHHLARFVAIAADKATTMGHIKREELAKADVVIPDATSMDRIGGILQPMYDLIISNRIENRRLAALRDTLLPLLMSGEFDISEVLA